MKLFIFEPYEWAYCGGAIGVIANGFKEAVDIIIKEDEKREEEDRIYSKKHFARTPNKFKNDHYDQWLLTHVLNVSEETSRVVFDNWNYS